MCEKVNAVRAAVTGGGQIFLRRQQGHFGALELGRHVGPQSQFKRELAASGGAFVF